MSESELGSVVNTAVMGQFMRIYARQSQMEADGGWKKKVNEIVSWIIFWVLPWGIGYAGDGVLGNAP